ncbi:hypothetical protein H5410_029495 [Solanum commersonii]|uniref:Uncharacterized protein n=1 Tax=Solanum commersonii TaxID=4109 RepID=A0A9J5Z4S7_SOLCO|nr:hypothetical protein H5410_029495 [Solanum commersonii]
MKKRIADAKKVKEQRTSTTIHDLQQQVGTIPPKTSKGDATRAHIRKMTTMVPKGSAAVAV